MQEMHKVNHQQYFRQRSISVETQTELPNVCKPSDFVQMTNLLPKLKRSMSGYKITSPPIGAVTKDTEKWKLPWDEVEPLQIQKTEALKNQAPPVLCMHPCYCSGHQ